MGWSVIFDLDQKIRYVKLLCFCELEHTGFVETSN